jgi:DNA-binding NarL/FixJ family response regulator
MVKLMIGPGESATIGDGPMRGLDAEVLTVDPSADLAQVRVRVRVGGQLRSGVAVVSLSGLHPPGEQRPVTPQIRALVRRGRPRQVTPEMAQRMVSMYASGHYTHARIASALGVSKSTVSHYLRNEVPSASDRGDHSGSSFAASS